tara:strand:- start:8235 stop:8675 length:441 start_codon:yes stop_codon:yes gene_type:complete
MNKVTGISNTPTLIAVFRNESSIANVRAVLQHMEFLPVNASANTPVVIQLVSNPTVTGGTWSSVAGSELEINQTATVTNGKVALTGYDSAVHQQGNQPASTATAIEDATSLGLRLFVGGKFAIFATTDTAAATCDLAWSVNWLEID